MEMKVIVINILGFFLVLGNVKYYSLVYTGRSIIIFFEFFGLTGCE